MTDAPPPSSRGSSGERRRRKKTRTVKKTAADPAPRWQKVGFWLFTVVGGLFALVATYLLVVYPAGTGPGGGREVTVVIGEKESISASVDRLAAAGLVASPRLFSLYARLSSAELAAGSHLVTDDAGPQELLRRLERRGGAARAKVIIPEGFTRFDIARRLRALHVVAEAPFLEATEDRAFLKELSLDASSAEGFLFPATYELAMDSDPRDVVRRLKSEFDRRFAALDQEHRLARAGLESSLGWTKREIVILASMVEKEAAVDEERSLIASVFLNRLRDPAFKRKLLQCDPTAGYGCLVARDKLASCAGYAGKITHAINVDPQNEYSTYVHEGLPPGPIANPGIKSLRAVLSPSTTRYLYFVARGEGRKHTFSETAEEHGQAVKDYKDRLQLKSGTEPH